MKRDRRFQNDSHGMCNDTVPVYGQRDKRNVYTAAHSCHVICILIV
jgi:hypothetical protein